MVLIKNSEVNQLILKKHNLLRQIERREITEEEGKLQVRDLDIKIKNILNDFVSNEVNKVKEENKKMAEEKKDIVKEVKEVKPKKRSENSNTWLIVDALCKKSTKTADDIVEKVMEKKEGLDKTKLKNQVKSIIRILPTDKRFKDDYTWDKESYLATKKE